MEYDRPSNYLPYGFWASAGYLYAYFFGKRPLNLKVESVRFYEKGAETVAPEARQFATHFPQQTTRYISCEVYVRIVRWQPSRTYELTCCIYRPDGSLQHKFVRNWKISFATYLAWREMWYGWDGPGHWMPGEYQAEVLIDGKEVERNRFTIVPPPSPPPPKTAAELLQQPRVRFYASWSEVSQGGERASIRFPHQTISRVFCQLTVRNLLYQQEDRSYTLTWQCYTVEGRLLCKERERYWLITSQQQECSTLWDCDTLGWSQGIYRVEVFIDGKEFAWGAFAIE